MYSSDVVLYLERFLKNTVRFIAFENNINYSSALEVLEYDFIISSLLFTSQIVCILYIWSCFH